MGSQWSELHRARPATLPPPLDSEVFWRLGCFASGLLLLLLLEALWPRRRPWPRGQRWPVHLGISLIDSLSLRLLLPIAAYGTAIWAANAHWGLFNQLALPPLVTVPVALLLLDLAIYWQHRLMHALPLLWRLHRMHHSDTGIDVTTALRFHPVEILLSMLLKMTVVLALGAPPVAVLVFEIVLNATAMFNHANLAVPAGLDRWLRRIVVTPDMHRVHHSWHREETDSNFGFNLPWWDWLFGSYRAQPRDGHATMTIGLREFREPAAQGLGALLAQPLAPLDPPR